MSRASGVHLDQLRPHLFLLRDRDATGHLLRVSGGLDSLVMGEGQILAQVKQVRVCVRMHVHVTVHAHGVDCCRQSPGWPGCAAAPASLLPGCPPQRSLFLFRTQVHKVGQNSPGFGRHLNGLFKQAVTAGKRVRAETSISSGAVSDSSAAAELAQLKLPTHDFNDAKVRMHAAAAACPGPQC